MNITSVTGKNWVYKKYDNNKVTNLCEKFSLDEIVSRLLVIRKINLEEVELYLKPKIKNFLPNPSILKDMDKSIDLVIDKINKKEIIGIFGDYDVDGASSTALIMNYLSHIKHPYFSYIPDRQKDGYGPTISTFEKIILKKIKLIITVDCGSTSYEAISHAKSKLVETIVLDHHQVGSNLPEAFGLVNPNRVDDKSNLNYLCASGVTFMFLVALNKKLRQNKWFIKNKIKEPNLLDFLDLVALGTVCDIVPLVGLNRAIVKQGLEVIKRGKNLGLKTLFDSCNINSQPNSYHIGYILGPRINAGGRVGQSSYGAKLLSSNSPEKAFKLTIELNKYNDERKIIENNMLKEIEKEAYNNINDPVLILFGDNWHEGIIGIAASRIKDKFQKPTIIISTNKNLGKASARSVYGFDIGSYIMSAAQLGIILKGGGHKMAGGFTIEKEKIIEFKKFLISKYVKLNLNLLSLKNLYIDSMIYPSALNEAFFNQINTLAPFGSGNAEPVFMLENMKVINSFTVSKKHIKSILLSPNGESVKSISFNAINTPLEGYLLNKNKKKFNIAGKISLNEWQGKKDIEFIIDDISVNKTKDNKVPSSIG